MEPSARDLETLRARGVTLPLPNTVDIAPEVSLDRIHGPGTVIHPGTRLRGANLLICPGVCIGEEAPATVDNCVAGYGVRLKGGYFAESVFLDRASVGSCAHIRAGTLLEEAANAAHSVGLKQTVLLPFVTLGSGINFCDILMAGGTDRDDHSEVGSSFVHFNFTPFGPRGDKATASLIGDIPHGVMLRSPRIFLGGQAGLVGPIHIDYGTVLAAGSVYRKDRGQNILVVGESVPALTLPFSKTRASRLRDRVEKNMRYIANLTALWHWYRDVRRPWAQTFAADRPLLGACYLAGQTLLSKNIDQRIKEIERLADSVRSASTALDPSQVADSRSTTYQHDFLSRWPGLEKNLQHLISATPPITYPKTPKALTSAVHRKEMSASRTSDKTFLPYIDSIRRLDTQVVENGTQWLQAIVESVVAFGKSQISPVDT